MKFIISPLNRFESDTSLLTKRISLHGLYKLSWRIWWFDMRENGIHNMRHNMTLRKNLFPLKLFDGFIIWRIKSCRRKLALAKIEPNKCSLDRCANFQAVAWLSLKALDLGLDVACSILSIHKSSVALIRSWKNFVSSVSSAINKLQEIWEWHVKKF